MAVTSENQKHNNLKRWGKMGNESSTSKTILQTIWKTQREVKTGTGSASAFPDILAIISPENLR